MRAEAWPYLVGRGFDHGYRVFLAPSFLAESELYLLEYASSGEATREGAAVVREIFGSAHTPMTFLYRVVRPTTDRYGLPGDHLLTDEASRPILVFEGFVLRLSGAEVAACAPTRADFEILRETVAPVFLTMWKAPARTEAARADPVAPTAQAAVRTGTATSRRERQLQAQAEHSTTASDPASRHENRRMELDFIEPFVVPKSAAVPEAGVVPHAAAKPTGTVSRSVASNRGAVRERGAQAARVARQTLASDYRTDDPGSTLRRVRGTAAFLAVIVVIVIVAVMVALLRNGTGTGEGSGGKTHGSATVAKTARPQSSGESQACTKSAPSTKPTPSATRNRHIRDPFQVYLRESAAPGGPSIAESRPQASCADPSG